jgi:hypothetical protein
MFLCRSRQGRYGKVDSRVERRPSPARNGGVVWEVPSNVVVETVEEETAQRNVAEKYWFRSQKPLVDRAELEMRNGMRA